MKPLRIAICCYPTFGGSGIIATELGMELARRGHELHFISSAAPRRLVTPSRNVFVHEVKPPGYPLFRGDNQYAMALASRMVEVARASQLDILHVHYAIPHAVAGYLAVQILGGAAPKLLTTLHGTDITIVGSDPHFLPVTRFAIERSHGVSVPSQFLRQATYESIGVERRVDIEVIPNFVDTEALSPSPRAERSRVIVHNSNFRPLKRVADVVRVFARVRHEHGCELVLIGDGPDRPAIQRLVDELGCTSDVRFLGEQLSFSEALRAARVFLLPSETESFGLAALEALSCGVPVVATCVGGLPEVVSDGETGFLADVGDVERMAAAVARLLEEDSLHHRMAVAARAATVARFRLPEAVDRYEDWYARVLER